MAGRGGGRGDLQTYGGRGTGVWGGDRGAPAPTGFVWPPPGPSRPRPAPAPAAPVLYSPGPATVVYHINPTATGPHVGAYQQIQGAAPVPARPAYLYAPARVTIRAPSPSQSPSATPFQMAHVSSGSKAPASAPATTSPAPSTAFLAKELEQKLAPVSKKGFAQPARPGPGTAGKKVVIQANHFLVNVANNNLFHYDVSINPESKSSATNRDESEEFAVTLIDPEKKEKERMEREYKIIIRIAGRIDLYHLQQFLCGRQRDMPQETIRVLDVVLRESPSWKYDIYVTVSRLFFSTTFGHYQSLVLLCCKACASSEEGYHTRLFPGIVVDLMAEFDFYLCSHAGILVHVMKEASVPSVISRLWGNFG